MDAAVTTPETFALAEMTKLRDALEELAKPTFVDLLVDVAARTTATLRAGGKVLFCGNGGSAADAQHLAAELVGRQNYDRAPLAGMALTVDTSALTAIGNDYGYDEVFARQMIALGRPGDLLFGLSTSGRSTNVVKAFEAARHLGATTVAVTGREPRSLAAADLVVALPATETAKVQELTLTCTHIVFAIVERTMYPHG